MTASSRKEDGPLRCHDHDCGTRGGAEFIREIAENPAFENGKDELLKAAKAFSVSAAQMGSWWKIVGQIWDDEEAQIKATADPEIRR